jgi:hypothetical protein
MSQIELQKLRAQQRLTSVSEVGFVLFKGYSVKRFLDEPASFLDLSIFDL